MSDTSTTATTVMERPARPSSSASTTDRNESTDDRPTKRLVVDLVPWLGWPVGGAMIVWGLVALARLGFGSFDLYASTEVAGLGVSRLMALATIAFGLLVWAAVAGIANRVAVRVYGAFALVVGLVFMIEPDAFQPYLGTTSDAGLTLAVIGALLAAVSVTRPLTFDRR